MEFYWYQSIPCQIYRLHIDEEQYNESQKYIRSKSLIDIIFFQEKNLFSLELLSMKFEEFINLITPVFANEAAEISNTLLRSTFDRLFDQNSNGTIEPGEFDSLFILLHGLNSFKLNLFHENLRQIFGTHAHHISFKGKINLISKLKKENHECYLN